MKYLFAQIGLGFDVRGIEELNCSVFIWFIGLVAGLICFILSWISGPRIVKVFFRITMWLTAMALWTICIWVVRRYGLDSAVAQIMPMFALTNTIVAFADRILPARW